MLKGSCGGAAHHTARWQRGLDSSFSPLMPPSTLSPSEPWLKVDLIRPLSATQNPERPQARRRVQSEKPWSYYPQSPGPQAFQHKCGGCPSRWTLVLLTPYLLKVGESPYPPSIKYWFLTSGSSSPSLTESHPAVRISTLNCSTYRHPFLACLLFPQWKIATCPLGLRNVIWVLQPGPYPVPGLRNLGQSYLPSHPHVLATDPELGKERDQ